MHKHPTHKSEPGFTLIEMLIVIAIIGILASVAIPQYSQYKIRGYDAQTKQALKNMHLLCNAYWLDTSTLQGCDLSKIKEETYGFNQNADVVATLPSSPRDNFCASAKHNDSPNTFSIDSASLISSGSGCGGSVGQSPISAEVDLDDPNREYEKISPKVSEVSCETKWANTSYTGSAAFAVDGDPKTKWTCEGMAKIGFDLGQKQVIDAVNVSFEGSVSNGNYVKIYVDGKLVAEGIQGATSKRWDIDNVEGQTVTYETIAQPHNEHNQTATWSEIGELTIEAGNS